MKTNRNRQLGWNARWEQKAQQVRRLKQKRKSLMLEKLEERTQPAGDIAAVDGSGNNLLHLDWGSTDSDFLRKAPAQYADGISAPGGTDRPSARVISNTVSDHPDDAMLNDRFMSNFVYA